MASIFEYVSHARLEYQNGLRRAFVGEIPEPIVYGVQGKLREHLGAEEGPPLASTLDHIVAAVAASMYGSLRGVLAGRNVAYDRDTFAATADGRIAGVGRTLRITSIHIHYDIAVPPDAGDAAEGALAVHAGGCPAHESVKNAIRITWDATLQVGERTVTLREDVAAA
jgi:hypothetical protein